MTAEWLPIRYRDFYDVPRAIVVEWRGGLYLFDCLFDDELEDYEPFYNVYLLPDEVKDSIGSMSWTDLGHRGRLIGRVNTGDIELDVTKREALNASVFERLPPL